MKKLFLMVLFVLVAQSSVATFVTDAYAETEEQKADRGWCKWLGKMAEMVMTGRQQGRPYSQLVREARTLNEESQITLIGIIDEAWTSPIVGSEALKLATVLLFKQENQEWCLTYHGLTSDLLPEN